jgi:hypothetical protein
MMHRKLLITVLGSGGPIADPHRVSAGYVLSHPRTGVAHAMMPAPARDGSINMPASGKSFSPKDLAQLIAFLQSRKHPVLIRLQAPWR